jgi:heme-degrading monooxygenase HmoA
MITISENNDLFTVVVRYTAAPEDQAELIEVLKQSAPAFNPLPGFISLSMHRSLDGSQVLVYLQWRSRADSEACMMNPVWLKAGQALMTKFIQTGRATMDVQPYEVVLTGEPQ